MNEEIYPKLEEDLEIDVLKDGSVSVRREIGNKGQDLFDILSNVCNKEEKDVLKDFLVETPKKMIIPDGEHSWCG